jgi:cation diffusion facilitator family transporter
MLAESIHSVADTTNQGLLFYGGRQAARPATPEHPFGYGRDRYFWSFVVALVLFSVGGLFAIYEGIEKLRHPHDIDSPAVAFTILGVAVVLELFSLRTAVKESNRVRGSLTWPQFVRRSKSPELPVVLLEDLAALVGLVFALIGVGMTLITENGYWDVAGTAAIGLLLVTVAITLAIETKSLLLGESAGPEHRAAIEAAVAGTDGVDRIIHLRTLHVGPEEILVAGKIAVTPTDSARDVADTINVAEERIRAAVPEAVHIFLEADIYRAEAAAADR